jgi:ABC-2 type transport system ATP-binding protein
VAHLLGLGNQVESNTRKQIGSLLETPNFYHYLSAVDNLKITQAISGRGTEVDIHKVLEVVNLHNRKHSKFSTYSLGMKQRFNCSCIVGQSRCVGF